MTGTRAWGPASPPRRWSRPFRVVRWRVGTSFNNSCSTQIERCSGSGSHIAGCHGGSSVALYAVTGGGHTWPGSSIDLPMNGHVTQDINAADLMLEFFSHHPPPSKNAKS